jgi:hypothetical protein
MPTRSAQLYDEDFYAWTRDQAAAPRRLADQRWNGPVDLLHLEDLGSEQQWGVESRLERIIEHLLKPSTDPRRQWMIAVIDARGEIERRMSATIQREVEPALPDHYRRARRKAGLALLDHGEADAARELPPASPYDFADLRADEWWPANRHGLTDQG